METGILNADTNEIRMEDANREMVVMKLNDAINHENAMLLSTINCGEMKSKLPKRLKDLIKGNNVDVDKDLIVFEELEIETMSIKEALMKDLVTEESLVKLLDTNSKDERNEILYCGNMEIVDLMDYLNTLLLSLTEFLESDKNKENIKNLKGALKPLLHEASDIFEQIEKFIDTFLVHDKGEKKIKQLLPLKSKYKKVKDLLNQVNDQITNANLNKWYEEFFENEIECNFANVEVSNIIKCDALSGKAENLTVIIGAKNPEDEEMLNIEEALERELINVECQTYKYDPENNDEISWKDAIKQNMMIACEVNKNMITPKYTKVLILSNVDEYINLEDFDIIGVVDTSTNNVLEKHEAIEACLLDLNTRLFFDALRYTWIPLREAIKHGRVLVKPRDKECELHRVHVDTVKIDEIQSNANLQEAIESNCIDQLENTYLINEINLEMRLMDAVMCGVISISETAEDKDTNPNNWLVLQRTSDDPEIKDLYNHSVPDKDINVKLLSKAQECGCLNEFLVVDDVKESIAKSIFMDHLELDPLMSGKDEKESILLKCVKGEVSVAKLGELLESIKEMFVGEIVDGLEVKSKGKDIIEKLNENNIVDGLNEMLMIDENSLCILSASNINDTNEDRMYKTKIEPSKLKAKLNQLRKLEELGMDTTENVLRGNDVANREFDMSLFEAVMHDYVDMDEVGIMDLNANELCTINESVERNLIELKTAENLLDCMESLSFERLIEKGVYDSEENKFGDSACLAKAIEENLVQPELVYFCYPNENKFINLNKLMDTGILNADTNEIRMEDANREMVMMKLNDAINHENAMLLSTINCEEMKNKLPRRLKIFLNSNTLDINHAHVVFEQFDIPEFIVADALKVCLLCDETFVMRLSKNKIVFIDNVDVIKTILDLNNFLKKIKSTSLKSLDAEEIGFVAESLSDTKCLLQEQLETVMTSFNAGTIVIYDDQFNHIQRVWDEIKSHIDEISALLHINELKTVENEGIAKIKSLMDSVNKSKLKLNTMNREIKKLNKYQNKDKANQISQSDILEKIDILKNYQIDLFELSESFIEFNEQLVDLQSFANAANDKDLVRESDSIETEISSLNKLHDNVNAELSSFINFLENLLTGFSLAEKHIQSLKADLTELEKKFDDDTKLISLIPQKLDIQFIHLISCKEEANKLETLIASSNKDLNTSFNVTQLFDPILNEVNVCSQAILNLKAKIQIKENLVGETQQRLKELTKKSECYNELLENIDNNISDIKTYNKTDKTLQNIIDLRKRFMETIDEFQQLKNSCQSYINNPMFQDKDMVFNIYNNAVTRQRELYLRINEELVNQVESKISILLIELGKLQMFVMDLPKTLNNNIRDIKNEIVEIKAYLDNMQMMEKELQNIDKALSEDLSDHLEINFELLEKAIMNIQYCEKERLSTFTDLDKICNIIANNYLPTIIIYENNKELAENMIADANENLKTFIVEFNKLQSDIKRTEVSDFMESVKNNKVELQKLTNTVFEIEPLVESVESYGFDLIEQLIELTSDYGCDCAFIQSIKNGIQDLMQTFKLLKNKVNELDSKMIEILSPSSKSMSEKLANEYESWRSLNDILNRLDPIQSFPEKLNKQYEEISFLLDQIKKKEALFQPFKQTINKIISENDNKIENQEDPKDIIDEIPNDFDNMQYNETQELNDSLKEIESIVDSVFYKVEHRIAIINDLRDVANNFWPEITNVNKTIHNIQKEAKAIEAFPNNKRDKLDIINRQLSLQSDSLSVLSEVDDKSTISSIDFELEDKLNQDFEIEISSLHFNKDIDNDIVNQELVKQQHSNLKKMGTTLQGCVEKIHTELEPKANQIIKIGGQSCELEINEFTDSIWEEVGVTEDVLEEKEIIIDKALYFVNFLSEEIKKIFEWFPVIETRLHNMDNIIPDQKMIELNIIELKSLNNEIFSNSIRFDKITSAISEIMSYPYVPNKEILEDLKFNISDKYSDLIKKIMEKHNDLQKKYNEIGELDFALEDNIGILQEFENQIKNLTRQTCKGDPEFTFSCLKNLRLLANAFNGLQNVLRNLNERVSCYGDRANNTDLRCRGTLSIFGKMKEIKDLSDEIQSFIPEKDNMIQEILKNEKLLSKELHAHIDYLEKINAYLKQPPKLGLNQESVAQSNQTYMNCITDLNKQRSAIEASLKLGNAHVESCVYDKCTFLKTTIKTLAHKYKRCLHLSEKRKEKLNYYSQIILEFDKEKQILVKDILELEILSIKKMNPSKLTAVCSEQIKTIKASIHKADKCFDTFENLNIRSFEIKCFGTRIDNSQLNLELKEYSLKLMKIQKCLRERIRIFNQAYREDKLFTDSNATLTTWLDESYLLVESFKHDQTKVLEHLDKLKTLCKQLSAQYANFHCTIRYGSYLKDRCVKDDPEKAILLDMLKTLRVKWNKIRILIITEKTSINRKLIETGNINDAMKCVNYWIKESIVKFTPSLKLYGDIDTVEVLIGECRITEEEANNHEKDFDHLKKRMLKEIKDYEEIDVRNIMKEIEEQFSVFVFNVKLRSKTLQEALELATDFNNKLDDIRGWLKKSEKQLKMKSLPKFQNEAELIELIEKHDSFMKILKERKIQINNFNNVGQIILNNCHPMAKNYLTRIIFTIGNRWNLISQRADDRSKKLNESLGLLRGSTALIEELIYKVNEYLQKVQNESNVPLPNDISTVNDLINKLVAFNNGLVEMDSQIKTLISDFKMQHPSSTTISPMKQRYRDRVEFYKNVWRNSRDHLNRSCDDLTSNSRLNLLNSQFNKLWKMSIERKASLQKHLINLNEKEQLDKFDFNTWKLDFLNFIKARGFRLNDLFRRQPAKRAGYHTLSEFSNCLMKSGFPTNKSILQEVFNIFNKNHTSEISYQDFIDSMRPERRSQVDKTVNVNDKKAVTIIIHDIIEREVAKCTCQSRYYVKKEGDNKYRFGVNNKMYMVRYLNSAVMVRIGGGWQTITEFLLKNDPCRVEKVTPRTSIMDPQKSKSMKSPLSSESKTGRIIVKPKSPMVEDQSPVVGTRKNTKPPSLTSKIPAPNISKLPKK